MLALFITLSTVLKAQAQNDMNKQSTAVEIQVDVYPNPTSEQITIDLSNVAIDQPKFDIRSIIGSKMNVYLEKTGLKKYKVNVSNFPRGYYLVLVREDRSKFQQTVRFSKK